MKFRDFKNKAAVSFINKYVQKELMNEDWTKLRESWKFLQDLVGFNYLLGGISLICSERAPNKTDNLPSSVKRKRLDRKMAAGHRRDLKELRDVTSRVLRIDPSKSSLDLVDIIRLRALLFDYCKDEHFKSASDLKTWKEDRRLASYEMVRDVMIGVPTIKIAKGPDGTSQKIWNDELDGNESYRTFRDPEMNLLNVIFVLLKQREGALRERDVDTVSSFFLFWRFETLAGYDDEIRDLSLRLINRTKAFVKNGEVVGIEDPEKGLHRYIAIRKKSM
jgi:hypothetical protein